METLFLKLFAKNAWINRGVAQKSEMNVWRGYENWLSLPVSLSPSCPLSLYRNSTLGIFAIYDFSEVKESRLKSSCKRFCSTKVKHCFMLHRYKFSAHQTLCKGIRAVDDGTTVDFLAPWSSPQVFPPGSLVAEPVKLFFTPEQRSILFFGISISQFWVLDFIFERLMTTTCCLLLSTKSNLSFVYLLIGLVRCFAAEDEGQNVGADFRRSLKTWAK